MAKKRYEIMRSDKFRNKWFIWDNKFNSPIDDQFFDTIYFDSYEEAVESIEELG